MEKPPMKSPTTSTAPKGLTPLTQEDLRQSLAEWHRLIDTAGQGDEALDVEINRLFPPSGKAKPAA